MERRREMAEEIREGAEECKNQQKMRAGSTLRVLFKKENSVFRHAG